MSGKGWRYLTVLTYKTHFTVTYTTANLARTFKQEASYQHQIFFYFFYFFINLMYIDVMGYFIV